MCSMEVASPGLSGLVLWLHTENGTTTAQSGQGALGELLTWASAFTEIVTEAVC